MAVTEVTSEDFRSRVLESDIPVVVDFYADWCMPCRHLSPVIEELADRSSGRVAFVKLVIDQSPELASNYGVSTIPTVALFEEGKPKARSVGVKPAAVLARDLHLGDIGGSEDDTRSNIAGRLRGAWRNS